MSTTDPNSVRRSLSQSERSERVQAPGRRSFIQPTQADLRGDPGAAPARSAHGGSPRGGPPPRAGGAAFTLIEIMVVLAIFGLLMGLGARGFRALAKSDLRASSAHLSGAIRYLFDRASTTGKIHRLVIDLNEGKYWAEVSDDRFFIPHEAESEADIRRREEKEATEDEELRREEEKKAKAEEAASSSGSFSSMPSSYDPSKLDVGDFKPKRARFAAFKELALKPVDLKNCKIRSFYSSRLTEALTSGRAYLYFFPLGQTEAAIITLADDKDEGVYSLVVHPITGQVKIHNEEVFPPRSRDQTDDEGNKVVQ